MRFCNPGWKPVALQLTGLILLLSSLGTAQPTTVEAVEGLYRGMIGHQQVVLEIGIGGPGEDKDQEDNPSEIIIGRYFYFRHGVAIPLKGRLLEDGSIRFREFRGSDATGVEWLLTIRGKSATGTLCQCDVRQMDASDGFRRNISLIRMSKDFNVIDRIYNRLLLEFPLHIGSEIRVDDQVAYIMQTDLRLRVSFPRLTRFPDVAIMEKVNKTLARHLTKSRLVAADCYWQAQSEGFGNFDEIDRVTLITRDLLSMEHETPGNCSGAYPNYATTIFVYNLHTGAPLDLKDIFQGVSKSAVPPDGVKRNRAAWSLLRRLYMQHYRKPNEDCRKNNLILWQFVSVSFDKDSMGILPGVDDRCQDAVYIPYTELRRYVKQDSPLRALVEKGSK